MKNQWETIWKSQLTKFPAAQMVFQALAVLDDVAPRGSVTNLQELNLLVAFCQNDLFDGDLF